MKKVIKKISAAVLLMLMCLAALPLSAFAAGKAVVEIPVSIKLTGELPEEAESFILRLTPADTETPMPEGFEEDCDITVEGNAAVTFPAISYTTTGVYSYTVQQIPGANEKCTYDDTVYYVRVSVTNGENGGLEAVTAAHTDAQMESKKQTMEFVNTYEITPDPQTTVLTVKKEWSDNGKNRPSSVTVQLLDGDEVAETVTLGDWNDWKHTWDDLEAGDDHDWQVKEINIPKGYKASYSRKGNVVTIRNTESLIQTGQLNWPVPVMAGLGLLLILAGILLGRKRNADHA